MAIDRIFGTCVSGCELQKGCASLEEVQNVELPKALDGIVRDLVQEDWKSCMNMKNNAGITPQNYFRRHSMCFNESPKWVDRRLNETKCGYLQTMDNLGVADLGFLSFIKDTTGIDIRATFSNYAKQVEKYRNNVYDVSMYIYNNPGDFVNALKQAF